MKKKETPKPSSRKAVEKDKTNPEGYPLYPDRDDIYKKAHEEKDINPEDKSRIISADEEDIDDEVKELDFNDDVMGNDLDVPGSELDDDDENSGNEDEENNYYSIGGDRHEDLEEDNGE